MWTQRAKYQIIGIDEAGRGALAGPVVSAGCLFLEQESRSDSIWRNFLRQIDDSKKLTAFRREQLFSEILTLKERGYLDFFVSSSSSSVIDRFGIREATRLSMGRCIRKLMRPHCLVQIDGRDNFSFWGISHPIEYIIKWDTLVSQIMVASIIAKVTRDQMMRRYGKQFPTYSFWQHKGYWTAQHQRALEQHGPCREHRMTYAPVRDRSK